MQRRMPQQPMRLIEKSDTSLAIALITGVVVIFERPLRLLFDSARAIELRYEIDLIPGLAVLVGALAFHHVKKRAQAKQAIQAAHAETSRERQRSAELERLVAFGAALSAASDVRSVRQVFWRFMPAFAGDQEIWMLVRAGDGWEAAVRDASVAASRPRPALEALAADTLDWPDQNAARTDGVPVGDDLCFPMMMTGGAPLGVVGVRGGRQLPPSDRRAIGAAVALLASTMRNVQLLAQHREISLRDQLTGCFNRAYAVETLGGELQRAKRSGRPLSVMMFDIDRFKRMNDEHGHLAGDAIIAAIAGQISRTLRASDIKCRWGGDEFLIILPDTPLAGAEHAGGSLTRDVSALRLPTRSGIVSPTISVGVAVADPGECDPMALIERADEALYRAKGTGRNRFVVSQPHIRAAS
jgi:diguanylate cyclase (GGDEF)-like protein